MTLLSVTLSDPAVMSALYRTGCLLPWAGKMDQKTGILPPAGCVCKYSRRLLLRGFMTVTIRQGGHAVPTTGEHRSMCEYSGERLWIMPAIMPQVPRVL